MKNHVRVNGKLLQTNKTWSHLKQQQKEWITNLLKERYVTIGQEKGKIPSKSNCQNILSEVVELIEERGIWIPEHEVKKYFNSKKTRWQKQFHQK